MHEIGEIVWEIILDTRYMIEAKPEIVLFIKPCEIVDISAKGLICINCTDEDDEWYSPSEFASLFFKTKEDALEAGKNELSSKMRIIELTKEGKEK